MQTDMHFGAAPELFTYAREARKQMTEAEALLWVMVKDGAALGVKVRRQHPILFFVADFYCHPARLVIEIDGGVHRERDQHSYDEGRSHELQDAGIEVIRFSNEEVLNHPDQVVEAIRNKVHERITLITPGAI